MFYDVIGQASRCFQTTVIGTRAQSRGRGHLLYVAQPIEKDRSNFTFPCPTASEHNLSLAELESINSNVVIFIANSGGGDHRH